MSGVVDTLARFVIALDDHDWERVESALAGTVRRDYSSLFGNEPDTIAGPALTAEWRGLLSGLDSHQHLLGPAAVDVDGDEASADVPVIGTHVLGGDPGSPWVVGGTYRFELRRDGGRWRVASIRLDARWQTGDAAILERARSA